MGGAPRVVSTSPSSEGNAQMASPVSTREALDGLYSVDAQHIDELPWEAVPECPGVHQKTLWRFGDFVQALVRYQPGSSTPGAPHLAAHHHIWVVSGAATMAGRRLVAGSYMHVPPGVLHTVEAVGSDGFTILQMHRPHPPREAEFLHALR
jgi:quercetin dioxygenase-like cupin family protein